MEIAEYEESEDRLTVELALKEAMTPFVSMCFPNGLFFVGIFVFLWITKPSGFSGSGMLWISFVYLGLVISQMIRISKGEVYVFDKGRNVIEHNTKQIGQLSDAQSVDICHHISPKRQPRLYSLAVLINPARTIPSCPVIRLRMKNGRSIEILNTLTYNSLIGRGMRVKPEMTELCESAGVEFAKKIGAYIGVPVENDLY